MNERIQAIIVANGLKKTEFAKKLNVSQAYISQLCSGTKTPSDRTIADICREFNVNYEWLTTGDGEMFTNLPQTVLDELCQQYSLDDFDRALMQMYISLTDAERRALKAKMKKMIRDLGYRKDDDHEESG